MVISQTVLILAGGTAVLSVLFGIRIAMRVVAGRAAAAPRPDGGEAQDIGPGDSAVFPVGWAGTWQIHETIRKLYVLF